MQNTIIKITSVVVLAIAIFYGIFQYSTLMQQQLKNEAVNGCLTASGSYEYTDSEKGVKTTAPQKEVYKVCLIDKGYTTIWQ
jgi:hypothetical protein